MQITIEPRNNYGNVAFYPVCDSAKHFAAIAGTVTLTTDVLKHIKALGYEVKVGTIASQLILDEL